LGRLDERQSLRLEPGRPEEHDLDLVGRRLERTRDDLVRGAVTAERVDRDAGHRVARLTGRGSGAARLRGHCRCRRSGRRDGPASAIRTAGTSRGAAPRSRAWRAACRDATWRFSASERPRPASLAEVLAQGLEGLPAGVAVLLLVRMRLFVQVL